MSNVSRYRYKYLFSVGFGLVLNVPNIGIHPIHISYIPLEYLDRDMIRITWLQIRYIPFSLGTVGRMNENCLDHFCPYLFYHLTK